MVSHIAEGTYSGAFEHRVLRRIFGVKTESGENYILRSFMIRTLHHILFERSKQENKMGGTRSEYEGEERCIQDFGGAPEG